MQPDFGHRATERVVIAPAGSVAGEYALRPDVVVFRCDDGSGRLLDLDGDFFALPEVGLDMLGGVLRDGAERTILRISEQYQADPARVRADLEALLAKLVKQRVIERSVEISHRGTLRDIAARLVIVALLRLVGRFRSREALHLVALVGLARISFLLFGWARTVKVWQASIRRLELGRGGPAPGDREQIIRRVDKAIRWWAASVPSAQCKERSLCSWFLLRSFGIPATLVVGIRLYPLGGHCWCQVGSQMVADFHDRCETFMPIIRYS
jgi:hypothetical protein